MSLPSNHEKALRLVHYTVVVGEAIEELYRHHGPYPAGEIYARLMGHMSLDTFNTIMDLLKKAGMITINNHLITWTGPIAKGGGPPQSEGPKRDASPQTEGDQHR